MMVATLLQASVVLCAEVLHGEHNLSHPCVLLFEAFAVTLRIGSIATQSLSIFLRFRVLGLHNIHH